MTSQFDRKEMRQLAEASAAQKAALLAAGGYMTIQNDMMRKKLPLLVQKYGAAARDAFAIWAYLHAYTHGNPESEFWLWAYPSRDQICADLAIGVNRFARLTKLLEDEGMLHRNRVVCPGRYAKTFFLPLI